MRRLGGTVGRPLPLAGGFAARVPAGPPAGPAPRLFRRGRLERRPCGDAQRPRLHAGRRDLLRRAAARGDLAARDRARPRCRTSTRATASRSRSIDTGVTPTAEPRPRACSRASTSRASATASTTSATARTWPASSRATARTSSGAFEGAAPETRLVSVKVAGWDGATDVSTVIAALQWVVSNRARFNIRVVNLSWGTDAASGYGVDPLDLAVERAWAGGPRRRRLGRQPGPGRRHRLQARRRPVRHHGRRGGHERHRRRGRRHGRARSRAAGRPPTASRSRTCSRPASRSSPTARPGRPSTRSAPTARLGPTMFKGSGTSQAAAVVAGVAARMLDVDPTLTNDEVKGVLTATADQRLAGPGGGAGVVDALAATTAVTPPKKGPAPVAAGRERRPEALDRRGLARGEPRHAARLRRPRRRRHAPTRRPARSTRSAAPWNAGRVRRRAVDARDVGGLAVGAAGVGARRRARDARRSAGRRRPCVAWEPAYWGAHSALDGGLGREVLGREVLGRQVLGTGSWQ